jgi:hypothetical protein
MNESCTPRSIIIVIAYYNPRSEVEEKINKFKTAEEFPQQSCCSALLPNMIVSHDAMREIGVCMESETTGSRFQRALQASKRKKERYIDVILLLLLQLSSLQAQTLRQQPANIRACRRSLSH